MRHRRVDRRRFAVMKRTMVWAAAVVLTLTPSAKAQFY
jgi:hypothetical protein